MRRLCRRHERVNAGATTRGRLPALLLAVLLALGLGCQKQPPSSAKAPEPSRPARDVGIETVRTPLACVKDGTVYLMDGEGNGQRPLRAPGQAVPGSLSWSPDSRRVAFWTADQAAGPFRLCVADVPGNGEAGVLYTAPAGLGGDRPVFSADGAFLYAPVYGGKDDQGLPAAGRFAVRFSADRGVLQVPVGGGQPRPFVKPRPSGSGPVRWLDLSPDGRAFLAVTGPDVHRGRLAIVSPATGDVREERGIPALLGRWSPRQVRAAYLAEGAKGAWELRLWTPQKKEKPRLVVGELTRGASFAWAPGGRALACANGSKLAILFEQPSHDWASGLSQEVEGGAYADPTWIPSGHAVVVEFRQQREGPSVLRRFPIDAVVSGRDFFPGGVGPVLASGR